MADDHFGGEPMTPVIRDGFSENLNRAVPTAAIAGVAAGHEVALMIRPAIAVGEQMIQRQLRAVFNRHPTICTGKAIAKVNGQALFFANPIHSLPLPVALAVPIRRRRHGHLSFVCVSRSFILYIFYPFIGLYAIVY
jgi:hypothetical protein